MICFDVAYRTKTNKIGKLERDLLSSAALPYSPICPRERSPKVDPTGELEKTIFRSKILP